MQPPKFQFEAIGTYFEIVTTAPLEEVVRASIRSAIASFDATFSRFRHDSLVMQAAKNPGVYTFPTDSQPLLELYESLLSVTNGKVSPLVGHSLEALGYDAQYSLAASRPVAAPDYHAVIQRSKNRLTFLQPTLLDIGAAGKGFIVDKIAQLLEANGIDSYVIDASGDIRTQGSFCETIGLEDPIHPGKVIGQVTLQDASLCASATNRRRWGSGLHHVIDPQTGMPSDDIIATWVIASDTVTADGLATALFFTEPEKLKETYNYEYMRITNTGGIDYSAAFEGSLYEGDVWKK